MPIDTALTASGQRQTTVAKVTNPLETYVKGSTDVTAMQEKAWSYFETVGEASFYGDSLVGKRLKKYLFPLGWEDTDGEVKPLEDVDHGLDEEQLALLYRIHATLRTEVGGPIEFWSLTGTNLAIGAQAKHLLASDRESFKVVSPLELKNQMGKFSYEGKDYPKTRIFDIWSPHPKDPKKPYAALWSSFTELDDLRWVSRYISTRTRNRLVQNDILYAPNSISTPELDPARANAQGTSDSDKLNSFEAAFKKIAQQNLQHIATDKAPMPMIVFGPDDASKAMKWITSEHKIDPTLLVYLHQLRERFANNISVPGEMMTGLANANHWNASMIEDDLEFSHITPLANMMSMSVTLAYFRPTVRAQGELNNISIPEEKLSRIRVYGVSTRKSENLEHTRNVLRAYDLGVIGEEPVADALGIPRDKILPLEEQARRAEIKNPTRSSDSAPSRQPDQRNRPPGSPDPERSRDENDFDDPYNDDMFNALVGYDMHRTAGNRILNWAKRNPDIHDGLQLARGPEQVGRYAGRSTLTALGANETKLWEGLADRIKYAARYHPNPQHVLDNLNSIAESIQNDFWGD